MKIFVKWKTHGDSVVKKNLLCRRHEFNLWVGRASGDQPVSVLLPEMVWTEQPGGLQGLHDVTKNWMVGDQTTAATKVQVLTVGQTFHIC